MLHTAHPDLWILNPFLPLCMGSLLLFHSINDFLLSPRSQSGHHGNRMGRPDLIQMLFFRNNVIEKTVHIVLL